MTDKATQEEQDKRPWMSNGPSGYYTFAERMPMDLFSYSREATHCLDNRRSLATVVMASTAVELILNRDRRLRKAKGFKKIGGWVTLNNHNLRVARRQGLPVECLVAEGDRLGTNAPIKFVAMRNKVAHGEISEFITDLSDYDPAAAKLATEQRNKCSKFVAEWYNSAPDVQYGHIRNRQWPRT